MIMVQKLLIFLQIFWFHDRASCLIRNNARNQVHPYRRSAIESTISKVSLTQKGYIQFLKYIDTVPPLTDYTFCIWMNSNNLTYNHPILSYSKNEEERLIRVWISPFGKSVNLEILGQPIFEVPVDLKENHWYHICQSWSSHLASWNLYLNGKLRSNGYQPKLSGIVIKGKGDIVVGQEYTDFDKGLEDGIEGDIFGFNFVLASTSHSSKPPINNSLRKSYQLLRRHQLYEELLPPKPQVGHASDDEEEDIGGATPGPDELPHVLSYFTEEPVRNPKGLLDVFKNALGFFEEPARVRVVYHPKPGFRNQPVSRAGQYSSHEDLKLTYPPGRLAYREISKPGPTRTLNDVDVVRKTLGLLLVELSFDCGLRRGAPLSGEGVLINWTKTPVRVFGGAILKSEPPFCT